MDLIGRIALVTGASRGFGKHIALELAARGADVALAARTAAPVDGAFAPGTLQETAAQVEALGRRALIVPTDLSDQAQVVAMVETTIDHFGGIDLLMNNAGMGTGGDICETLVEDWNNILAVNLTSQFLAIKIAGPVMRSRGGGAIVNMGSYLGQQVPDRTDGDPISTASTEASGPGITPYGVTKAAIERLTLGAAADLASYGIRVNCIAPRWTETEGLDAWFPSIDKSHWERPEDWAKVVGFLMSPQAGGITGRIVRSADMQALRAALTAEPALV
ncbi:SDR family NAD(P)-dependent oxidoreductase [Nocardioides soli]|uniref:NAD(P)-dependent dehydrogenase (Short-subunit alcohol dehydrogenase family) n=1 Tax=Nocardioides soli TaxID=1036020 RepID=A0A7W4VX04_9ACTN|nr:SDR family oxidoreductase [Nocardioides soli]MBB3042852.1 NAD(P)-dependent dehydrogenase (short-subunit alcohol dehydrogenase family) [Nocardioides soli]